MKATIINCTLKPSPESSNTDVVADQLAAGLTSRGVDAETIRAVDHDIRPGIQSAMGDGDEWPAIRERIVASEIVVLASPTWPGQPSSVSKRVLERMDTMLGETNDATRPVAYNRVGGVVVTGNEDGAHHVISEITGALIDLGFTIPGQAWTCWNKGPGPGDSYVEADDPEGKQWTRSTAEAAAANLVGVAQALAERPVGPPPGRSAAP